MHAHLKNDFTAEGKYHNLMRLLICVTIKLIKIRAPEKFAGHPKIEQEGFTVE